MTAKAKFFSPSVEEVVFSVKTFAAAMLALLVALCFDLQNPYWAVGTVFIVSSPLSGASTSKAVYRLLGTAIGGAVAVILVPNLVNSPELLTLAISLWMGLCVAISLLDRTPRSYTFLLAGYTTAFAGFPIVSAPETAFTYPVARVTEIAVGIICAALVSRVFFPRHAGPVLARRIDKWLADGAGLAVATLKGEGDKSALSAISRRLAAEAVDLRGFTTHVAYDPSGPSGLVGLARTLQRRMVAMLPIISGIADARHALLRETQDICPPLLAVLVDEAAAWIESEQALSEEKRREFLDMIAKVEADAAASSRWQSLLVGNLVARLRDLIQIWSDCLDLKQDITSGSRHDLRWRRFGALLDQQPMHKDYGMAAYSGFSAMVATIIAVAFWIMTGWSQGGTAAMMTGVVCCLFSTADNPTPMILAFLKASIFAVVVAFSLEFGVLPAIHGFVPLVAILGVVLIPLGILMARPSTMLMGLGFCVNLPNMLSLQGRLNPDFESFVNSNSAILVGLVIASATTSLIRTFGAEWSAHRLLRAGWNDIAMAARTPQGLNVSNLLHRMLDRLGLVGPRLALIPAGSSLAKVDILKDLRNGLNTIEIQRNKGLLDRTERPVIDEMLEAIAEHYQAKKRKAANDPSGNLLALLDRSIGTLGQIGGSSASDTTLRAITGIRYNLFPDAPPYHDRGIGKSTENDKRDQAA